MLPWQPITLSLLIYSPRDPFTSGYHSNHFFHLIQLHVTPSGVAKATKRTITNHVATLIHDLEILVNSWKRRHGNRALTPTRRYLATGQPKRWGEGGPRQPLIFIILVVMSRVERGWSLGGGRRRGLYRRHHNAVTIWNIRENRSTCRHRQMDRFFIPPLRNVFPSSWILLRMFWGCYPQILHGDSEFQSFIPDSMCSAILGRTPLVEYELISN